MENYYRDCQLFFELVQVSLGRREKLSRIPSADDWSAIYEKAEKQTVAGLLLNGLERLPSEQRPPQEMLLQWIGVGQVIEQQNNLVDRRCVEVTKVFSDAGFKTCILKGQGNAKMYPKPESRTPGDIDLWVFGHADTTDSTEKSLREEITKFVKERCPEAIEQYHHVDFPIWDDVPVEVHYTPGKLLSPKYNRRFQRYCKDYSLQSNRFVAYDGFSTPSVVFNAVYQMAHIMIHFFIEGIGLRHFVDYYYVLCNCPAETKEIAETITWLGMEKFARGVMWIEQDYLGLEEKYLLFEPSLKVGRLILKEMLEGGNFGHYDNRFSGRNRGLLLRGAVDTVRLLQLSSVFPAESFWKIINKMGNQKWRIKSMLN